MSATEKIELTINGQVVQAQHGQTIYEVVTEHELDEIPTLCHSPALEPYSSCFVCVVEIAGKPSLVPSCSTKVTPGMVVNTRNERIVESRKTALELLMSNHYADCVAPCVIGCPAHVDVQGYIALAARGQYRAAADLIRETNPLPAVCGRVCVRKCEGVCRRLMVDDAVAINDLKRFITDTPGVYDGAPERAALTGKRVAIVGAGPAGLTCAYFLGRMGHQPTILEMMPEAGGMLRYGIPEYRLPRDILAQEVDYIMRAGAEIVFDVKLGEDVSLPELRDQYDAVFLAMGAIGSNAMRVEGEYETEGVLFGLDYLMEMADSPKELKGTIVVVGGGNTAMDAARTSLRLGADKVIVAYRRTRAEMPADDLEIDAALEEGVQLVELTAPKELVKDENGRLKAIRCILMRLGEPDDSGRRRPEPVPGSEFEQLCDYCIAAIGQSPILDGITDDDDMPEKTRWNTLVAQQGTYATRVPGVFTGGDVETGPSVVIDCIAGGKEAAKSIDSYLSGAPEETVKPKEKAASNGKLADTGAHAEPIIMRKDILAEVTKGEFSHEGKITRQKLPEMEVEERSDNFEEVALGFSWEEAHTEWDRCLSCGCMAAEECSLRDYCTEYGVDMAAQHGAVRKRSVDDRHPCITIDENKCILCTQCIRTCEKVLGISALGLVGRGFSTVVNPAMGKSLAETSCVSCGNCVSACPTGALLAKYPFPGAAVVETVDKLSTCGFCSLGCEILVRQSGPSRFWIEPPKKPGAHLCRFGRFGSEVLINQERVECAVRRSSSSGYSPERRSDLRVKRVKIDLDQAYQEVARGLETVVRRHGPESVVVFASPELTNEQLFVAQRIAREGLGTNNVGCLSTLLTEPSPDPLTPAFGFTASTADRSVLEQADVIVLRNCDLENDQLILGMKVIEAVQRGAKLIVTSAVASSLHDMATLKVSPLRGTSTMFWYGVEGVLLEKGIVDKATIDAFPGGGYFRGFLEGTSIEDMAKASSVEESAIRECADILADAKHVVFIESTDRTVEAAPVSFENLGNLMALLHLSGRKSDLLLPRQAFNTAGLETCGMAVEFLPGRVPVGDDLAKITANRDMLLDRLKEGSIKGALIIGEDPLSDDKVAGYLQNLEFLAVIEETYTETAMYANVLLPGTNYLEEEGSRVNFEGNLGEFSGVLDSPAGVQGWRMLAGIAEALNIKDIGKFPHVIRAQLDKLVRAAYGKHISFYWNTGQERGWEGPKCFQEARLKPQARTTASYLSAVQRYKRDAQEIGVQGVRGPRESPVGYTAR